MSLIQIENLPITPSETDVLLAEKSSHHLQRFLGQESEYQVQLLTGNHSNEVVMLPDFAIELFVYILSEVAKGNEVTIMTTQTELTTQQAAKMLNVSRPFLIQLLEKGEIPYHKVGSHRRIRLEDVMRYKQEILTKSRAALDELTAQAQELDMGY